MSRCATRWFRILLGRHAQVALADPADIESLDSLRISQNGNRRRGLNEAPNRTGDQLLLWERGGSVSGFLEEMTEATTDLTVDATQDVTMDATADGGDDDAAPLIRLVSLLILEAFRTRASDIHLEPLEKRFRLRYRIDGSSKRSPVTAEIPQNQVISRVKLMAGMDLTEHSRVPKTDVSELPPWDANSTCVSRISQQHTAINRHAYLGQIRRHARNLRTGIL